MLTMIMAFAASASDPALPPCKAALANKAGGQIATIDVASVRVTSRGRTIKGQLTAFQGMGAPAPGSASAHHLIRIDYSYTCRVRGGRVREAALNPLRP